MANSTPEPLDEMESRFWARWAHRIPRTPVEWMYFAADAMAVARTKLQALADDEPEAA